MTDSKVNPSISKPLAIISDLVTEAHTRIQQDFSDLDPVVGVSRKMRDVGIPADAMTIDCLRSGKRIIVILHDEQADIVRYQFSMRDQDPGDEFEVLAVEDLSAQTLYDWMKNYLKVVAH